MLVTISLMILRVQNHGQHCDALQAHESTQPVLKGISEILSLIYLIYYLITATRALAVFSLSLEYTQVIRQMRVAFSISLLQKLLYEKRFCHLWMSIFLQSGSKSEKYVLRLLCNDIGSKLESQRVFTEISRQHKIYKIGSRTILNSEYDVKSFLLQKYLGRLK